VTSDFFLIKKALFVGAILICFQTSAFAYSITFEWDPNTEEDLAGYIIYYTTSTRHYIHDVDIGDYTSCTISELKDGIRYFFAVTAYDEDGDESAFSKEVCYPDCPQADSSSDDGGCFITSLDTKFIPWLFILGFVVFMAGIFVNRLIGLISLIS
jgi:hypothetical protein